MNEWKNVSSMEMEAYIGLCILRAVFKGTVIMRLFTSCIVQKVEN